MLKNLAATLVAACCFSLAPQGVSSQTPAPSKTEPLKVGFLYVAPLTEAGWVHQHDVGRKELAKALGKQVQTTYVLE